MKGTWVAQSVEQLSCRLLVSAQVMISGLRGRDEAPLVAPAQQEVCLRVSLSLSLCPSPFMLPGTCTLPL